jgi:Replication-relaxation
MTARYLTAEAFRELAAKLTERDLAVLKQVSALRFVSGDQLARLCFVGSIDPAVNARAARRALLRLVRLGALARLPRQVGGVRSGSAGFVYHLGLGGQRLAIERDWQPERRRRRSLVPGHLFVRHALQVAELHTQLVEGDRSRRFELLELAAEPSCWRSFDGPGGQRQTLKPDSFVRLGLGPYEDSYFIEVDRGTEGSRALERQLQLYAAYAVSGREQAERGVFPRVLWLAPDDQRAGVIADCVARQPRGARELFRVARFADLLTVLLASKAGE